MDIRSADRVLLSKSRSNAGHEIKNSELKSVCFYYVLKTVRFFLHTEHLYIVIILWNKVPSRKNIIPFRVSDERQRFNSNYHNVIERSAIDDNIRHTTYLFIIIIIIRTAA